MFCEVKEGVWIGIQYVSHFWIDKKHDHKLVICFRDPGAGRLNVEFGNRKGALMAGTKLANMLNSTGSPYR